MIQTTPYFFFMRVSTNRSTHRRRLGLAYRFGRRCLGLPAAAPGHGAPLVATGAAHGCCPFACCFPVLLRCPIHLLLACGEDDPTRSAAAACVWVGWSGVDKSVDRSIRTHLPTDSGLAHGGSTAPRPQTRPTPAHGKRLNASTAPKGTGGCRSLTLRSFSSDQQLAAASTGCARPAAGPGPRAPIDRFWVALDKEGLGWSIDPSKNAYDALAKRSSKDESGGAADSSRRPIF